MKLSGENMNALVISLRDRGFTLVEVLVAIVITLLLLSGVYTSFISQQEVYSAQQGVADMQQNLRGSTYLMQREIRMAGYNPTGNADSRFLTANADNIKFTSDIRGDAAGSAPDGDVADPGETISYYLWDCDGDGDTDLRRQDDTVTLADPSTPIEQIAAENIDAIEFLYFDKDGNQTAVFEDIRMVQITQVSHTDKRENNYTDNKVYKNKQGTTIFTPTGNNVKYRHRVTCTMVKCKNMGL